MEKCSSLFVIKDDGNVKVLLADNSVWNLPPPIAPLLVSDGSERISLFLP